MVLFNKRCCLKISKFFNKIKLNNKAKEENITISDKQNLKEENIDSAIQTTKVISFKGFIDSLNLTNSLIISYLEDDEFERNVCIMRGLDLLEEYLLSIKINSIQYDKETDWVKQYTDEEVMQRLKRLEKVINENIEKLTNNEKVKFFLMIMDNQICFNLLKVNETKKEKSDECVEQL